MLNSPMVITKLRQEIMETRSFLEAIKIRRGHHLLDHTVARYLWGTIATADCILAISEGTRFIGAQPLLRHLLETAFALKYLLVERDPDEAAARIFVWEALNAEENGDIFPGLSEEDPMPRPFEARKAVKGLCKELRLAGDDADVVETVFAKATQQKSRHWHWTGKGPGAMISEILKRGKAPLIDKLEMGSYRDAWPRMSAKGHATARWSVPGITLTTDCGMEFDDPLKQDDQKAAAMAGLASLLLKMTRGYAAELYEHLGLPPNQGTMLDRP